MNNKIKIVATAAIAAGILTGCGKEVPMMPAGAPPLPQNSSPASTDKDGNIIPPMGGYVGEDGFVNVDPPVSSEFSGEEAVE